MAGETNVTLIGRIGRDPELRFTPSGASVCNFSVASQPRKFDKASGGWVDGDTLWMNVTAWRELGDSVAESLSKGDSVIVYGRLEQRHYETRDGQKRTVVEMQAEAVGPNLRWATARVQRVQRSGQVEPNAGPWGEQQSGDPWGKPPATDPWAGTTVAGGNEPPF